MWHVEYGKENADVLRANEHLEVLQKRLDALQAQFEQEAAPLQADIDPMTVNLNSTQIRPRKSDISISIVGICWIPFSH